MLQGVCPSRPKADIQKGMSRSKLYKLIDEAQLLLYSTGSGGSELRAIWGFLNEKSSSKEIQWVLADSDHWKSSGSGAASITSKMGVMLMKRMSRSAAEKLIEEPFSVAGIHPASSEVTQRILNFSGRQPCYIQALCSNLLRQFMILPRYVDIITIEMVEKVEKETADLLNVHFELMYQNLRDVLDHSALSKLLSGNRVVEIPRHELAKRDSPDQSHALSIEAIPGLILLQDNDRSNVIATEIFRYWAKKRQLKSI